MESIESSSSQPKDVAGTSPATAGGLRFSQLSPPRQAMVRLCQEVNFGTIQDLCMKDGEPVFVPPPRALIDVKLDSDDGQRPEVDLRDFALRSEVLRLMALLDEIKDGKVERIEVRPGLPRRILIERRPWTVPAVPQQLSTLADTADFGDRGGPDPSPEVFGQLTMSKANRAIECLRTTEPGLIQGRAWLCLRQPKRQQRRRPECHSVKRTTLTSRRGGLTNHTPTPRRSGG